MWSYTIAYSGLAPSFFFWLKPVIRTGLIRVLAIILGYYVGRVLEFVTIGIILFEIKVVSRPVYLILKPTSREPRVQDIIDDLFFLIIDNNGVGGD